MSQPFRFTIEVPSEDDPFVGVFALALAPLARRLIEKGIASPAEVVRGLNCAADALLLQYRAKPGEEPAGYAVLSANRGKVDPVRQ